jgi:hypothetical protein
MNMWKDVIGRLASATRVIAEWRLSSGVTFYMYLPTRVEMGDETIKADSDVRFDEINQVTVMRTAKLGGFTAKNDLAACREALTGISSVQLVELDEGIRISSK